MKAIKLLVLSLFVLGLAACSKGGDQDNAQEKAQQHVQQPAKPAGGYDPNADADSDC